jgi:hypothetical protein
MAPRKPLTEREQNLLAWRAAAAFTKFTPPGEIRASFDDARASIVEVRGMLYVVLKSGKVQLAVFRIRTDGQLKRLRRPPRELKTSE